MKDLTVHGIRVPISSDEVSHEIWAALQSGRYEANEARRIPWVVRPGDRVLELGAGIGVITSVIASIDAVHVWSFEADPCMTRLARRVIEQNCHGNVTLSTGILAAGPPAKVAFYRRKDFWMSSKFPEQGPHEEKLEITSVDIDQFITSHRINVIVMDVEGAELEIAKMASLPGVQRVFLELHDHLYGLAGVRAITEAMSCKGLIFDPRASSGPCVLYSLDDGERKFDAEVAHAV